MNSDRLTSRHLLEIGGILKSERIHFALHIEFPLHLLQGPWTKRTVKLCRRIKPWMLGSLPTSSERLVESLNAAIIDRNTRACQLLMSWVWEKITPYQFKLAVENGCSKLVVQRIVRNLRERYILPFKALPETRRWVEERANGNDEMCRWLLKGMDTDGYKIAVDWKVHNDSSGESVSNLHGDRIWSDLENTDDLFFTMSDLLKYDRDSQFET